MAKAMLTLVLLCMMTGPSMAQEPTVTSLMLKELTEIPGKEVLMITVVHIVGRNASGTKPAKFLVLLVKKKGAPVLVPAN
jgi:hypothetical protein